jgi:hypothetical protein
MSTNVLIDFIKSGSASKERYRRNEIWMVISALDLITIHGVHPFPDSTVTSLLALDVRRTHSAYQKNTTFLLAWRKSQRRRDGLDTLESIKQREWIHSPEMSGCLCLQPWVGFPGHPSPIIDFLTDENHVCEDHKGEDEGYALRWSHP